MPEDARTTPDPAAAPRWQTPLALAAALAWCYAPNLVELAGRWRLDPDYNHGFFVIPLALAIAWRRRAKIARAIAPLAAGLGGAGGRPGGPGVVLRPRRALVGVGDPAGGRAGRRPGDARPSGDLAGPAGDRLPRPDAADAAGVEPLDGRAAPGAGDRRRHGGPPGDRPAGDLRGGTSSSSARPPWRSPGRAAAWRCS